MRDLFASSAGPGLTIAGFVIGMMFGWLTRASRFCVMGAISDWRMFAHHGRAAMVAAAALAAVIGAQLFDSTGSVELDASLYLSPGINWLGAMLGGLIFGIGMVLAGGCPARALVRAAAGDITAAIVLVIVAFSAYVTFGGPLAHLRVDAIMPTAISPETHGLTEPSLTNAIAALFAMNQTYARALATLVVCALLAILIGHASRRAATRRQIAYGLAVGALIPLSWAITSFAYDPMDVAPRQPIALSFVKPVADAIDWLERSSALGWPAFATATVLGTLFGAAIQAMQTGSLRLVLPQNTSDFKKSIFGAMLMGIGGILAAGCTIGQGLSGLSTLSLQSFIACAFIIAGALIALEWLQRTA